MDKHNGWIKLHRSLHKWEWYDDIYATRVLIHLLLTVNHKDSKYKGHVIKAGSRITGIYKFSEEVGLSQQQTRTALKKVKESGEITIKSTNKFSIISLTKWEQLQYSVTIKPTNEQQTNNKRATTSKEDNNIKEIKNNKKVYNFRKSLIDLGFKENLVIEWLKVRKTKKATNTETALKAFVREVEKTGLEKNSILERCVVSSWTGFKSTWLDKEIAENSNLNILKDAKQSARSTGNKIF
jgi:hypothetical protein